MLPPFVCRAVTLTGPQCSSLALSLPGKVIADDDAFYDARLKSYYSANAAQAPWCMVLPEGTEDVSKIANILSTLKCPFGMRGGAHSAFKGSNGIKDGVTIDFGKLTCNQGSQEHSP